MRALLRSTRAIDALLAAVLLTTFTPCAAHAEAPHAGALPEPLRLRDVQRFARDHRAEIRAAKARARAAAERPAIVSALEPPMLETSLDHLPFALHGADFSAAVEQRFPLSYVRGHRERAAEAEARRQRADAARVGLDVELDATGAFLMLHERRQRARILGEQLALARDLVSATNARYGAAAGAQSDVLRAEMELSRLEGEVRAIGPVVAAAAAMLNVSLARPADAALPALESAAKVALPPGWEDARAQASAARPELSASRAEIARAEAEIDAMGSMYWPMATVRTGPAYTMTDGGGWMLMVGISLPIWQGSLDAGVREAEAMASMARADASAMARMVEGEAAVARERVLAAREWYLALRDEVVPRARRVIDPALSDYGAGTVPLVSVIDAAQMLWSAEAELVLAELELGMAWARFDRATAHGGKR